VPARCACRDIAGKRLRQFNTKIRMALFSLLIVGVEVGGLA
jgi:hypothetical protein